MPTGKIGRSCHPSERERRAGVLPSETQQGKEEQRRAKNAWRQNQTVYTQEPVARGSCSKEWCSAYMLEAVKKRMKLCFLLPLF